MRVLRPGLPACACLLSSNGYDLLQHLQDSHEVYINEAVQKHGAAHELQGCTVFLQLYLASSTGLAFPDDMACVVSANGAYDCLRQWGSGHCRGGSDIPCTSDIPWLGVDHI